MLGREPDQFRCSLCGGVFDCEWSEEEALAELEADWGVPKEECDEVCDDCYEKIKPPTANEAMAAVQRLAESIDFGGNGLSPECRKMIEDAGELHVKANLAKFEGEP